MKKKRNQLHTIAVTTATLALSPLMSQGAVISAYTFASDLSATTADANVTANDFTVGAGIAGSARSGSTASLFARASVTDAANQISLANAITANDYFSFTVDVGAGFQMDLTNFQIDLGYTRIGSFEGKQFRTYLLTSIDGFTTGGLLDFDTVDVTSKFHKTGGKLT